MRLFGIFASLSLTSKYRFNYAGGVALLTPFSAQRYLDHLIANDGVSRGYYVVDELTWQEREQALVDHDAYTKVPFSTERFWYDDAPEEHFAHVSTEDPRMIAFTANAAHGQANRQTRMRPGKYLQKFYPKLTPKQVAYYAEWFTTGDVPDMEDGRYEFRIAMTADEIEDVYVRGPSSCMAGPRGYGPGTHLARSYAGGDIGVAYLVNTSSDVIEARALCYPEGKSYSRIYIGSCQTHETVNAVFRTHLRSQGWDSLDERPEGFDGARFEPVAICGEYRLPYIDRGGYVIDTKDDGTLSFTMDEAGDTRDYHTVPYQCDMPPTPPEIAAAMALRATREYKHDRRGKRNAALRSARDRASHLSHDLYRVRAELEDCRRRLEQVRYEYSARRQQAYGRPPTSERELEYLLSHEYLTPAVQGRRADRIIKDELIPSGAYLTVRDALTFDRMFILDDVTSTT